MKFFLEWRFRALIGLISKLTLSKLISLQDVRKILVIIAGGIGDGIMALPALRTLIDNFPNASISLISNKLIKDIIDTTTSVREWIPIPKSLKEGISFLLNKKFDMVFVNVIGVHHTEFLIYSLLSGAGYRLGPKYPQERFSTYSHPYSVAEDKHDVIQNLEMLAPIGIKATNPVPVLDFPRNVADVGIGLKPAPIIGIHPGGDSRQKIRRWPAYKFSKLVNALHNDVGAGLKLAPNIWLFEGEDEPGLCSKIANLSIFPLFKQSENSHRGSRGFKACPELVSGDIPPKAGLPLKIIKNKPIKEVCSLIGRCTIFITSDSGLGHIADALGVPTVTIFGPANPKRTAPFRNQDNVIYKSLPCSPCYATGGCIFPKRKCLELIEPEDVLKVIEKIL